MDAWPRSAFADEISTELDEQVETLARLGIRGYDLRSIDDANVLHLSDPQVEEIVVACRNHGLHVQCIGSPVNKVALEDSTPEHELKRLTRAIEIAEICGTRRVRIFSPVSDDTDAVLAWIAPQVQLAAERNVVLLHENDARIFGAFPGGAAKLLETFGGPHFRAVFDFANTVLIGLRPFPDWFPWLLPHLDTLHIKDAIEAEGRVVPAGEGDGQIEQTLRYLAEGGWQGTLSFEPHLQIAGAFGGSSGTEGFERAVRALDAVLARVGGTC